MGVTFWGNFASRTLLVPFHWRGMCMRSSSAGKGRRACGKLKKRRQILGSAFTSSISTLVVPVIGTMTPGDFIIILLPSTDSRCSGNMSGRLNAFWRLTDRRVFARLGMRAIIAVIKVGRLSRDSGRYLVGPVQLREQFEMGNVASLGRKNLPVDSSMRLHAKMRNIDL
jgi:hypothetical protein